MQVFELLQKLSVSLFKVSSKVLPLHCRVKLVAQGRQCAFQFGPFVKVESAVCFERVQQFAQRVVAVSRLHGFRHQFATTLFDGAPALLLFSLFVSQLLLQLNGTAGYSFTAKAGDSTDRFVLHFDAVATGINAATANEADRNDDTYTLDGRKVNNPTAPGLYIKGGKKVIK